MRNKITYQGIGSNKEEYSFIHYFTDEGLTIDELKKLIRKDTLSKSDYPTKVKLINII